MGVGVLLPGTASLQTHGLRFKLQAACTPQHQSTEHLTTIVVRVDGNVSTSVCGAYSADHMKWDTYHCFLVCVCSILRGTVLPLQGVS